MSKRQVKPNATFRVKAYNVIQERIERGIHRGLRRARKYMDSPTDDDFADSILINIMGELDEVVDWETGRST